MATLVQAFEPRTGVFNQRAEVEYNVFDAADEDAVKTICYAEIPVSYNDGGYTLYHREIEIKERLGETTWKVTARYKKPDQTDPDAPRPDPQFAFDTSGGTQHITQSLETLGSYKVAGAVPAPNYKQAIGYDGENVNGTDITVPGFKFSETHFFFAAEVTEAYKKKVANLTGRINPDIFRGFARGEVLFLGAAGSRQGDDSDDLWQISFNFARFPNTDGFTVGDVEVGAKKGWEYYWVLYADAVDDAAHSIVRVPKCVYIERVYEYGNFGDLGI